MKLIGGRDYYDGAGWGVDEGVIFVRDGAFALKDVEMTTDHPFRQPGTMTFDDPERNILGHLRPFLVLLAGKLHAGLEEKVERRSSLSKARARLGTRFHYDVRDALSAYTRHHENLVRYGRVFGTLRSRREWRGDLEAHFERKISKAETDWCIENHATVLSTHLGSKGRTVAAVNHACLKDIDFYRKVDPPTAHMAIQNFISGVLPFSSETVELSDRDRIRKAGFDLKSSFRKAPTKRTKV